MINNQSAEWIEIEKVIESKILTLYKDLTRGNPSDADKDAALTWWNRGQVYALESIRALGRDKTKD